jgi:WD40 repeat protein
MMATAVSWSFDGNLLATGSTDYTAKVWNATSGEELRTLHGHTHQITQVSWAPNDNRLATASRDGTARIWQVSE